MVQSFPDEIGTWDIHDPTIVHDDTGFTMFSTDTRRADQNHATRGIQRRHSSDLVHWSDAGTALNGIPADAEEWSHAGGLWAPEVVPCATGYRLYYAASTFGSQRSAIGLATSPSLSDTFTPQGIVLRTDGVTDQRNALDPNVVIDGNKEWLCYGSFFAGIYLVELNPATGLLKDPGNVGHCIAARPRALNNGSIEGPFIYHSPVTDDYYLFASYDSLSHSYNIRVGRAKTITGPYLDYHGNSLMALYPERANHIGTKILGSRHFAGEKQQLLAPGHCSVLDLGTTQYLVYHNRLQPGGRPFGMVSQLHWTTEGWPVVSPNHVHSVASGHPVLPNAIPGDWDVVTFTDSTDVIESQSISVTPDMVQTSGPEGCVLEGVGSGAVWQEYDWSVQKERVVFSGLTSEGWGVLAKRQV